MYVLSYCTIKDKQRNIISFLSSTRKMATWQFTNRPLLIKLYRVMVFVQISMKFFFPWKAFLMYYNPSNKFFTHLYHNSRHNCLKKCSVFFCAMVRVWRAANSNTNMKLHMRKPSPPASQICWNQSTDNNPPSFLPPPPPRPRCEADRTGPYKPHSPQPHRQRPDMPPKTHPGTPSWRTQGTPLSAAPPLM